MPQEIGVLFICLGNICRSPLAHGVFQDRVDRAGLSHRFVIDSCGTNSYHQGEPPDPGSVRVARAHGLDVSGQRSRPLVRADLTRFEHLICMDASNRRTVERVGGDPAVRLLREWDVQGVGDAVPDPWGGGFDGFEHVYQIVDRCCDRLLDDLINRHGLAKQKLS